MGFLLILTPYIIEHAGYSGEILVAHESLNKPFDKAIVYIDRHDIGGATGVVVNKPLSESDHSKLAPFLRDSGIPVSYGGPLEFPEKIVVLIELDPVTPGGRPIFELGFWDDAVREMPDLLTRIQQSLKRGEQRYRVFAGYTSWGPFQLESETLVNGSWYAIRSNHDLLFQTGPAVKWEILEPAEKAKGEPKGNQS